MSGPYSYDRRAADGSLAPEEAKAISHLSEKQKKDYSPEDLAKVAKAILRLQKDSAVKKAGGKNPYPISYGNSKSTHVVFLAPRLRSSPYGSDGESRVYYWTGDSLSKSDRVEPKNFETEEEANKEIREKVLKEIERYHPGDDVFILGW